LLLDLDYVICHMVSRSTNLVMSRSQELIWHAGNSTICVWHYKCLWDWQIHKYNISWLNSKAR
jgi:hypothetical protein